MRAQELLDDAELDWPADEPLDTLPDLVQSGPRGNGDIFFLPVRIILQKKLFTYEHPVNGYLCNDCGKEIAARSVMRKNPRKIKGGFWPATAEVKCPACGSKRVSIKREIKPELVPVKDNYLDLRIDLTCTEVEIIKKTKQILSDLKKDGLMLSGKRRKWLANYETMREVSDLKKSLSAEEIARKLWPEEYEKIGGRTKNYPEKGRLLQRVYDYQRRFQDLIESVFPARKHLPEIKK